MRCLCWEPPPMKPPRAALPTLGPGASPFPRAKYAGFLASSKLFLFFFSSGRVSGSMTFPFFFFFFRALAHIHSRAPALSFLSVPPVHLVAGGTGKKKTQYISSALAAMVQAAHALARARYQDIHLIPPSPPPTHPQPPRLTVTHPASRLCAPSPPGLALRGPRIPLKKQQPNPPNLPPISAPTRRPAPAAAAPTRAPPRRPSATWASSRRAARRCGRRGPGPAASPRPPRGS